MGKNVLAEICVGAALFRGNRLLLVKRTPQRTFLPGCWEIPGGHVEEGESLEGALDREVREETGYAVLTGKVFDVWEGLYTYGGGRTVPMVEADFLCLGNFEPEPKIDPSEHTECAWVRPEELPRFDLVPIVERVVKKAFEAHGTLGHAAGRA